MPRQHLLTDFHRPHYHFLPPANWMNDPNGLIQWQGKYHLFYQHNPSGPLWGDIHWGHAASLDLIHWEDLPIALTPTPGGSDERGCFSGCAINADGVPTIIYTGVRGERHQIQTQNMATGSDDLLTWQKYAGNPIISQMPEFLGQTSDFRDPFVWKEGDTWYMVLGSRVQDVGGIALLYRSRNLTEWEYLHPLHSHQGEPGRGIWECPNFFPFGDQWVLIISGHDGINTGTVIYFVGTYQNQQFTPTTQGVLDYGTLYAPLTFADQSGRRLLFGWLRESRSDDEQRQAGWSGVQSIPRVLALDSQNRLVMTPVPELDVLRGQQHHIDARDLGEETPLDVRGLALDIQAEFSLQPDGRCGFALLCSPDGSERTEIIYEASSQKLIIRSGANVREIPHSLAENEPLTLRILLDGSVIEIIANGRTSVTYRAYPTSADHDGVLLIGAKARLQALDLWEMPSIWA